MPHEKNLSLQDLSYDELNNIIKAWGYPSFRAEQVYIAAQQNKDYDNMSNLPKDLRHKLKESYFATAVTIIETFASKDGTEKYLYRLNDGNVIEGVFMPHSYGNTLCVSTQVGCRLNCAFCASSLNGLIRNLTSGEMLGQVLSVNALKGGTLKERKITNIVLMGSGEPLDNFDNVVKFLKAVSDEKGINISLRNISLSTAGLVDKIIELADMNLSVTLTISLHAPDDKTRSKLMPINNKYNIPRVIEAAKYYFEKTGRRVIFEYSLIDGQNSDIESALKLAKRLKGFPCHVNLINLNFVKERGLRGVSKDTTKEFLDTLAAQNISATLRRSMGNDIEGACGQLRNKYLKEGSL
ncbi:MAG: 23S rRNA (adenine(2503)-C(2))-methyltransferase RlmN [Clostridiales bacterium]|nr:23S rRNA (adenine(2503)-C(2))-methyltransferase RlmN [Clostridiales bacterium]